MSVLRISALIGICKESGAVVVFDEYGPTRMIRTMEWKYIHHGPYGPDELYHLTVDPDEYVNLIEDPAYAHLADELYCRMAGWFHKYADSAMDAAREGVTGLGQMCRTGIYADRRKVFYS